MMRARLNARSAQRASLGMAPRPLEDAQAEIAEMLTEVTE